MGTSDTWSITSASTIEKSVIAFPRLTREGAMRRWEHQGTFAHETQGGLGGRSGSYRMKHAATAH